MSGNRLITMDEVIADLFIYAWENGIDETTVLLTFGAMNESPVAAAMLAQHLGGIDS